MTNSTTQNQPASAMAAKHRKAAFKAFSSSKDAAIEAVANVYLVYLNTLTDDGPHWLEDEIKARNTVIAMHNNLLKKRRDDVETYKQELHGNPHAVPTKQVAADLKLSKEDWAADERVKIDTPRKGASPFTTICRLVLEFDYPHQASHTSRYCAVLEWLEAKFGDLHVTSIQPLVDAIKEAGGFEKVLFMQRHGASDEDDYASGDREIVEQALRAKIKSAIAAANAKANFAMAPSYATSDNVVIMYGRYENGTVSVIDELPLENSEIDGMLRKLNNKALLPVDDATEFVARALSLGEMVDTGKKTKFRVNSIAGANQIQEYSLLSMIPDGSDSKLLVSACMAATSIVVHAKAGAKVASSLVQTRDHLYMRKACRKALLAKTHDRAERTLYTLTRDPAPLRNDGTTSASAISWCLKNTALADMGRDKADRRLFWGYMANDNYRPVDVEPYLEEFSVGLTQAEMARLFVEYLKLFKSVSPYKKGAQPMNLRFEADKLTVSFKGQNDYVLPIAAAVGKAFELTLRPKDMFNLFAKLHQFGVCEVTLSGNISGVLKASFADDTGEYDVYIPTCDEELRLSPKFFAKIDAPSPVGTAAEDSESEASTEDATDAEAEALPA